MESFKARPASMNTLSCAEALEQLCITFDKIKFVHGPEHEDTFQTICELRKVSQEAAQLLRGTEDDKKRCRVTACMNTTPEKLFNKRCELQYGHKEFHKVSYAEGSTYRWEPPKNIESLLSQLFDTAHILGAAGFIKESQLVCNFAENVVEFQSQLTAAQARVQELEVEMLSHIRCRGYEEQIKALEAQLVRVAEAGMIKHTCDKDVPVGTQHMGNAFCRDCNHNHRVEAARRGEQ